MLCRICNPVTLIYLISAGLILCSLLRGNSSALIFSIGSTFPLIASSTLMPIPRYPPQWAFLILMTVPGCGLRLAGCSPPSEYTFSHGNDAVTYELLHNIQVNPVLNQSTCIMTYTMVSPLLHFPPSPMPIIRTSSAASCGEFAASIISDYFYI